MTLIKQVFDEAVGRVEYAAKCAYEGDFFKTCMKAAFNGVSEVLQNTGKEARHIVKEGVKTGTVAGIVTGAANGVAVGGGLVALNLIAPTVFAVALTPIMAGIGIIGKIGAVPLNLLDGPRRD